MYHFFDVAIRSFIKRGLTWSVCHICPLVLFTHSKLGCSRRDLHFVVVLYLRTPRVHRLTTHLETLTNCGAPTALATLTVVLAPNTPKVKQLNT
jgi:hypothetical protein